MAFLRLKTSHGHTMADVYSAFQKCVRRGDDDGALYWGAQIARPAEGYKGYPNALKKRLMQHALEDVGNINYVLALHGLPAAATWDTLVQWIRALCVLPKTRSAAWLNRVAVEYVGRIGEAPTDEIRQAAEALTLHRDGRRDALLARFGAVLMRIYKALNDEVLVFHTMILSRAKIIAPARVTFPTGADVDLDTVREVPDWAYDKHTAKGKAMGRGYAHFFETMVVAPRLFAVDPYEAEARALYLNGKEQRVRHILASAPAPSPVSGLTGYTDLLQTQPITGRTKPRTWFATSVATGRQVVIKGPIPAAERAACLHSEAVKVRLGLPRTNLHEEGEYLVQNCLIADYKALPTRVVTTLIEKDVRVPETGAVPGWGHEHLTDSELGYRILEALLFRKIIGANDTCTRNFIVQGAHVYSIDDAAWGRGTPYMWKTALVKPRAAYETALSTHWERLSATITQWRELLMTLPAETAALEKYSSKENWRWA